MKRFLAKYMLYIYLNFIKDNDIDFYKKWALPIIKFTIFIRSIYIWILSVVLFPFFIIGMEIELNKKIIEKNISKILIKNKNI